MLSSQLEMGCLKLTYYENESPLKVVRGNFLSEEKADAAAYRYGFNGKEKDSNGEWGNQTVYDYGFRIYNPSIAKFLSVDPLSPSYPELTPYQFASNRPIDGIDLDGLEYKSVHDKNGNPTGFEWDPENAYGADGKLNPGYYERGILFEDKGTWTIGTWSEDEQKYRSTNIGSAKVTVYSYTETKNDDGVVIKNPTSSTIKGSTMPSHPGLFNTLKPGIYEAVRHKHQGLYWALQLQNAVSTDGKKMSGVNIHYVAGDYTGINWVQRNYPIKLDFGIGIINNKFKKLIGSSEGCLLIGEGSWSSFYSNFPENVGRIGVIVNRSPYTLQQYKIPKNPDQEKIDDWLGTEKLWNDLLKKAAQQDGK